MLENGAPPSFWCWALNFNYSKKIDTSPYNYITGHHIDIKYLHSFFAMCYMHIPLKDRTSKLLARRAQRCRFLAYSYTTILVPTYVVMILHDNNMYGGTRVSKDIIFDESCVFDKYIDNSPTDEEFAALHLPIEDITPRVLAPNEPVSFMTHQRTIMWLEDCFINNKLRWSVLIVKGQSLNKDSKYMHDSSLVYGVIRLYF